MLTLLSQKNRLVREKGKNRKVFIQINEDKFMYSLCKESWLYNNQEFA